MEIIYWRNIFSKSSTPFSTISTGLNIQDICLIKTSNVLPQVLRKRTNINSEIHPYIIKEITPISNLYLLSTKKRKLEIEEMIS